MRHWGQDGETWSLELWPCQESSSSTGPQPALQSRAPAHLFGALGGRAQHAAKAHVPHSLQAVYGSQIGRSSSHAGWPAFHIPSVLHKRARRRSTPHPPPAPPPCGAACPASPHRPARWGGCLGSRPAVPCTAPCGTRRESAEGLRRSYAALLVRGLGCDVGCAWRVGRGSGASAAPCESSEVEHIDLRSGGGGGRGVGFLVATLRPGYPASSLTCKCREMTHARCMAGHSGLLVQPSGRAAKRFANVGKVH